MPFTLPNLPYPANALEPHIDARTMEIHHGKHHAAYVNNANNALKGTKWENAPVEDVLKALSDIPDDIRTTVRNNAGGHANHSLFWQILAPPGKGGGGVPSGSLAQAINDSFSSFEAFKEQFSKVAATRFGSGWAWLVIDGGGRLLAYSTANQDSPIMEGHTPILGLDVWEHAYYLHYQNRRPDYIAAWWNLVNWPKVAELYDRARK